ncbi:MAG: low molecular weight phosphatase family protein [Candidatus Paceibacterota bacterium]
MNKILFICRGNVARSQIAEAFCEQYTEGAIQATSAGTKLSRGEQTIEEFGSVVDNLITVMKEEEIDISKNMCKEVSREMANGADKIVLIVDDEDPVPDYLAESSKTVRWDIPDPKGKSLKFHREVRDKIKEGVKELLKDKEKKEK